MKSIKAEAHLYLMGKGVNSIADSFTAHHVEIMLEEFAEKQVNAALREAADTAKLKCLNPEAHETEFEYGIDKDSILSLQIKD